MQEVKVADVSIKTGTNQHGAWTNTMVTGEDGSKFGTFHKSATEITKGDVIKLEPVIKAGKTNFDSFEFVSKGPGHNGGTPASGSAAAPAGGGGYKRDVEAIRLEYGLKARLQAIERASIESQTAYNGIIELAKVRTAPYAEDFTSVFGEAIAWARKKMAATLEIQAPSEATGATSARGKEAAPGPQPAPAEDEAPTPAKLPHVGALLAWCANLGIDRPTFMALNHITEDQLPEIDIDKAQQVVIEHLVEHGKLKEEIFGKGT